MRITQHTIASTVVGGGVYAATRSWEMAAGAFIMGVFIDVDHIIDYWREHPLKTDLAHFFMICENYKLNKALLIMHSLEFLPVMAALAYFTRSPWITGFLIGWSIHMMLDHIGNKTNGWTYFLTHRILASFDIHKVFETRSQGGRNG